MVSKHLHMRRGVSIEFVSLASLCIFKQAPSAHIAFSKCALQPQVRHFAMSAMFTVSAMSLMPSEIRPAKRFRAGILRHIGKELHDPWTATVTFSQSTESHVGCVIHGIKATIGYDWNDLLRMQSAWTGESEIIALHDKCAVDRRAWVLVLRAYSLGCVKTESLTREYGEMVFPHLDRHFVSFGRVRQKHARGNAEIGPVATASDFLNTQEGKVTRPLSGVVIAFAETPKIHAAAVHLRSLVQKEGCPFLPPLCAEINHYGPNLKDTNKLHTADRCGIGFHGDSERPDVIGLVLGNISKELHFQAFCGANPTGLRFVLTLAPGDLYVLDSVACGHKWASERASETTVHFRHAAGPVGGNAFTPPMHIIQQKRDKKLAKR
jgi:hypothetical protein